MGCVFSFGTGWGSWQSISFCCWPLYFFFLVLARFSLDLTLHITTLLTFLPCSLFYLGTVLTTYPTNLATLLITYPILKPYPKCNTCILGHFESTHVRFKLSLYKDPTLNAILAFWAISKVRMWGLSIFIRRSYPKCNTCILGHTTNQATVLTTYLTNLVTLLITYPTNLTVRFKVKTHKLIDMFFINV
jgi:hypothetical protein